MNGVKQIRTTTTESLLGLLSLRECTGYELKKFIEESIGNFWSESFGQIYPALKKMEAAGWIEGTAAGNGNRERTVYRITEAGRKHVRSWLGMPAFDQVPRNELLLKLFFGPLAGKEQMRALLVTKRDEMRADLKRFAEIAVGLPQKYAGHPGLPYWLMTVRYGIAEAKALIVWCDESLAVLEEWQ